MLTSSFLLFGLQLAGQAVARPNVAKRQTEILCTRVFTTATTDTCNGIISRFGITLENFTAWNPALGADCAGFVGGKFYCIRGSISQGPVTGSTSPPATIPAGPTPTTTAGSAPTPDLKSKDGSCGGTAGLTCAGTTFGKCCSVAGWCGDTAGHCGGGCQSPFGTCDGVADNVSTDGACGANGKTCLGSAFGNCCSVAGWCGSTSDHCSTGCQSAFGTCSAVPSTTTKPTSPTPSSNVSTNGSCGGAEKKVCVGSPFGDCCSSAGWCGTSTDHCSTGCQLAFGKCSAVPTTTSAAPTPSSNVSTDGTCGGTGKKTCLKSPFGDCCSSAGWCGSSFDHCNNNCQSAFGTCSVAFTTTTSKAAPTPTSNVSQDGACGSNVGGKTCRGSTFGSCCSKVGWCGSTFDHCDTSAGCQTGYGTCSTSNLSTDGRCGSFNGKTCVGTSYGNCCSAQGYCGKEVAHCAQGCQTGSSSQCLRTNIPSLTGECGKNNLVCAGGPFNGNCCSVNGFCGKGAGFPC